MLENFTVRTFSEHLGGTFRIYPDDSDALDFELISATDLGERPAETSPGRPFSVVFRGGEASLPQRTYRMEHQEIGGFDIFLVPIGPDENGPRYEAIFN